MFFYLPNASINLTDKTSKSNLLQHLLYVNNTLQSQLIALVAEIHEVHTTFCLVSPKSKIYFTLQLSHPYLRHFYDLHNLRDPQNNEHEEQVQQNWNS